MLGRFVPCFDERLNRTLASLLVLSGVASGMMLMALIVLVFRTL
jgi:hypothetical protein